MCAQLTVNQQLSGGHFRLSFHGVLSGFVSQWQSCCSFSFGRTMPHMLSLVHMWAVIMHLLAIIRTDKRFSYADTICCISSGVFWWNSLIRKLFIPIINQVLELCVVLLTPCHRFMCWISECISADLLFSASGVFHPTLGPAHQLAQTLNLGFMLTQQNSYVLIFFF